MRGEARLLEGTVPGAGRRAHLLERTATGDKAVTEPFSQEPMGVQQAAGRAVSVPFVEVARWEGGQITQGWLFLDRMALASQLGLLAAR
jgi:hypothetical protein